ncbi:hypothetical protein QO001_005055 [Methylobacterium brachiatum]|uniref:Uncharacterized protein n=1 Tax=Methylobacterium brachiatum TaxID=269660 RepID=A0AAJ1TS19_9HYPH|nr:hypothetical protein [Methylobacterium brachiatum]MCB4805149.1 hypothetical protein [Methylobacterium brachiatum]MDQ0546106.1 hypothetical protein [Methylobacterium brachiatum]
MGAAAVRKAQEAAWLNGLTSDEQQVVTTARRLTEILPLQGACYRASLFLKYHLEIVHGIVGTAVVGFVNDGTDDIDCSHAWFEFGGHMTDLGLVRPLNPQIQRAGPLIIHGREFRSGHRWNYQPTRSVAGLAQFAQLLADPKYAVKMRQADQLHRTMVATAQRNDLIRTYLDNAPDGGTYDVIAGRL